MESALVVLVVTLFLILILFVIPEIWRRIAYFNLYRHQELNAVLAEVGALLRAAAGRLRPYRDLEAELFQQHYQPAREQLQGVVEQYRSVASRLAEISVEQVRDGAWAFPHFLEQPQDVVGVPRDFVRLWQLEREVKTVREALANAEETIADVEEMPLQLRRDAVQLAEQRVPALQEALEQERDAGLKALGDLPAQVDKLQIQTTDLAQQLQAQPAPGLEQMDVLAKVLVERQTEAGDLEAAINGLRRKRQMLDRRLENLDDVRSTIMTTAGEEVLQDGLEPLLDHAAALVEKARARRRQAQFDEAMALTDEAEAVLEVAEQLAVAAERVRDLMDVIGISLHAEDIGVLSRRLYSAFRAAYTLLGVETEDEEALEAPPELDDAEDRQEALKALRLRVARLVEEAQRLEQAHQKDVEELEQSANRQANEMAEAWAALQQQADLANQDPVAIRYQKLLQERTRATGNPLELRAFIDNAEMLTAELSEAAATLKRGLQRVENLRTELPELLDTAQEEADNWQALQPYLLEMREATATIWQTTASDVYLTEIRATLDEIDFLEEQARAAHTALMGERKRLALWERRIVEARSKLEAARGAFTDEELRRRKARADAEVMAARKAETVEEARASLQRALGFLQDETAVPDGE